MIKKVLDKMKNLCSSSCSNEPKDPRKKYCGIKCTIFTAVIAYIVFVAFVSTNYFGNKVIGEYIMKNPEKIMASIENMYKKKTEEAEKNADEEAKKIYFSMIKDVPFIGAQKAKYYVVKFSDYNCGHCRTQSQDLYKFVESGLVRLHIVHYPILSQDSQIAGYVSTKVSLLHPKKYSEFHKALFAQKPVNQEAIKTVLKNTGLSSLIQKDGSIIDKSDETTINVLKKYYEYGSSLQLQGTPFVIIGNDKEVLKIYRGYVPKETLENILK